MPRLLVLICCALILTACGTPTAGPVAVAPTQVGGAAQNTPLAEYTRPAPTSTLTGPTATVGGPTSDVGPTSELPANLPGGSATKFPDPKNYTWAPLVSGLDRPTDLTGAGVGRLLVIEQPGRIRLIAEGKLLPDAYLDITARVGLEGNEQGLLGIALPPRFAENGYFYVNYTDTNGNTVIARYQSAPGANQADPASEKVLLQVKQPDANHNGGGLAFGADGYLYIGLGDGGSGGDPQGNGQRTTTLLGKILRIDVDSGDPYAIPAGNPFAGGQEGKPEIWALGLRNPWRFSFDHTTGDLFIGDVGQNLWEEIDYLPKDTPGGANFGWNYREGANPFKGDPPAGLALVEPIAQYKHPEGCSVTGGYVYRGAQLPEFSGIYLYGDYCTGRVWGLLRQADGSWQSKQLFETGAYLSSFGQGSDLELYLLDHRTGSVLRLEKKGN
jgi:glucose/arabinose dehydrogenase